MKIELKQWILKRLLLTRVEMKICKLGLRTSSEGSSGLDQLQKQKFSQIPSKIPNHLNQHPMKEPILHLRAQQNQWDQPLLNLEFNHPKITLEMKGPCIVTTFQIRENALLRNELVVDVGLYMEMLQCVRVGLLVRGPSVCTSTPTWLEEGHIF